MARGWESKAVEGQVQEHEVKAGKGQKAKPTPAQIEARRHREILLLSRARVQTSLESHHEPRYREQLQRALADLDAQIALTDKSID